MSIRIAHSCGKRGGTRLCSHHITYFTDGIEDHELVLVAGKQVDRLRRELSKLGHIVEAGRQQQQKRRSSTHLVWVVIVRDI
jgi:hypothetical protein